MRFEKVGMEKLEDLVKTRIQVLRAANKLDGSADMGQTEQESRTYYEKSLEDGSHVAYLVYDGDLIIGTGGISFYQVMPTYHNPTGMKAYIMNMYTDPEYRRKGIAMKTLDMLVQEARGRGIHFIALEATNMGRQLYERYGFCQMEDAGTICRYSCFFTGSIPQVYRHPVKSMLESRHKMRKGGNDMFRLDAQKSHKHHVQKDAHKQRFVWMPLWYAHIQEPFI